MAQTKEQKAAEKVIKKAETAQKQQLKDAQKAEIKFLKAEGASKEELKLEKASNKTEFADAKGLLSQGGLQYIPQRRQDGFITSNVGTYQDTYAAAIQPKIEQAIGLLNEYNIPQSTTKVTDAATIETGMSLNNAYALSAARASGQPITAELLKDQYGGYVSGANRQAKIFNGVNQFASDELITADDFTKKLKPVKGQENLFTSKLGGGTTGVFQYNPETQSYQYLSATPVKVSEHEGGFFSSLGGQILLGIASGFLLGPTANLISGALGTGQAASAALAGGLLGAGTSAISGGDLATGALLGAAGGFGASYIGRAGGLGNVAKSAGLNLSDDLVNALNKLVSGVGTPSPDDAALAANAVNAIAGNQVLTADDIIGSIARETTEAGFPAGTVGSQVNRGVIGAVDDLTTGAGMRLTPNMVEDFIPTPNFGGPPIPRPVPGSTGGIGFNPNAPGFGFQLSPEDIFPTPSVLPAPNYVNANVDRYLGTSPSFLDDLTRQASELGASAYEAIRNNPLEALGVAGALASGVGGGGTTTGGVGRPPRLAPDITFDPAQFGPGGGAIPGVGPGNLDFNAFMNLYNRGGLGAGQYLGYDLSRMAGDIPLTNLLGTPILPGVMNGQAAASQTSLV
jgi:hypothetical protein